MDLRSRMKELAISETGFVFDPSSGATFTANRTGLCVLAALRDGHSRADVLDRLRSSFAHDGGGSPPADLENDLSEFLRLLVQLGVVPPDCDWEATA